MMSSLQLPTTLARRSTLCLLAMVLTMNVGCSRMSGGAAGADSSDAATSANAQADAKALGTLGNRSWYDSAKGEYRPPKVAREVDHPLRRDGSIAAPARVKSATGGGTGAGGGGGGRGWAWGLPSGEALGYLILVVLGSALIGVAIVLAATSLRTWLPDRRLKQLEHTAIAIDPSRVVDLPFEAQSEMQDPLAYAKFLINQGKLDEAVIFVYGYMLLALDRAGKITLHRGKTNRMYLHELADEAELRGILLPAMLGFEDVFFGRHSIDRERFRKIWDQLDHLHRALAASIAAAKPLEASVAS